ncbi:MAG: MBL fold metallo-hydrolase [Acidobacteriota bacterium]
MAEGLRVETFEVGPLENNAYLVVCDRSKEAVLVDPAMGSEGIADRIDDLGVRLTAVLNTHGHFDHIFHNALFFKRFGAKVLIHEEDLQLLRCVDRHAALFGFRAHPGPEPSGFLKPGESIRVGDHSLRVVHTPGHSPGGVCFVGTGFVLVGDTLFAQSIGRTDLPGGDYDTLVRSIRTELYTLPNATEVLPGHGPSTLIGFEKRHNPFVKGLASHAD